MHLERRDVTSQVQILPVLSGSYNNSEHSVQVFMKRWLKSDLWFQTEVEEGNMEDSYGRFKMLDISNRF